MITKSLPFGFFAACFLILLNPAAFSGSYKRIAIDGNFDDWIGARIVATDEMDEASGFDIRDVALANDEDYLYLRVRLHAPADYASFHHQVVVDTDADNATGHAWVGLGAELFIEDGTSYQQKNGEFNEGAGSDLEWAVSPEGDLTQFEARISRETLDAEGLAFFSGPEITVSIAVRNLEWQLTDSAETIPYTFAGQPEMFEGTATLTDTENTFWFYQEANDPEVPDWLLPGYLGDETWKGGDGFFGFGLEDGVYPPPVTVPLASGRTTYYFRVPFTWDYDVVGVALLAEALFSDGAVIYLNGDEVRRVRMPEGPISGETEALGGPGTPGEAERFSLPASALTVGENLLMVEVHQSADTPGDMAFGLTLVASDSIPPTLEDPNQPEDREIVEGDATTLGLGTILGTEPFSYQWYKNDAPIEGATARQLEISVVLVDDAGTYFVEVGNGSGIVRSRAAVLTTVAEPVSLPDTAEPADRTINEGDTTTFALAVSGSPLLVYQWYKDDAPIDGAVNPSFTIDNASLDDTAEYHVTVMNRVNSAASRKARLTVFADETAPAVAEITGASGTVIVRFSEPVVEAGATDVAHYTLTGIEITGAQLAPDQQTVTLSTGPFRFGEEHTLVISGVEDRFSNATAALDAPFRATILIDGNFDDWAGIDPVAGDPKETDDGAEFKDFRVVNDGEFLYLRFSFHSEIGQLPVDWYYQIYLDADNDPVTGLPVGGIGSTMMIENGNGWLQRGGQFNEGSVGAVDFLLAPQASAAEFECRISLGSTANADQSPIFTGDTVGVVFSLVSTSWVAVDAGPGEPIIHELEEWPPLSAPSPLPPMMIRLDGDHVILTWEGEAGLETSASTRPGTWQRVPAAVSPHIVDPEEAEPRYFRARGN